MLVDFFLCLVLAGRLKPSDSPLLLIILLLEDMTMWTFNQGFICEMHKILFQEFLSWQNLVKMVN